jgi:hypothetical protein
VARSFRLAPTGPGHLSRGRRVALGLTFLGFAAVCLADAWRMHHLPSATVMVEHVRCGIYAMIGLGGFFAGFAACLLILGALVSPEDNTAGE